MNRSIDQSTSAWLSSAEAIELLGVKPKTLYTYASRGWIQTRKRGRHKHYRTVDVHALRDRALAHQGNEARAAAALSWGEPVLTTAISAHDRDGPYYRGVCALDLVDQPLKHVAGLLWECDPQPWPDSIAPPATDLLGLARNILSLREHAALPTARRIVSTLLASVDLPDHPDIRAAMVLCADHGLNASTFATRVVASTGASLPACIAAGLTALSGPQHGTASIRVAAELEQAPRSNAIGFTHPFYPDGDPRGEMLLARCAPTGRLAARVEAMRGWGHPNLDVGLLSVCRCHGLPNSSAPLIFAVGRSLGWVAHVLEQRESARLIRPRSHYTW